jgi:hypothetical protein
VLDRTVTAYTVTYPGDGYTKFTSLLVRPAREGDVIRFTCRGRGCPFKAKTVRVKKDARQLSLLRHIRNAKLRKGVVVQLRVTRPGAVGRVYTLVARGTKRPRTTRLCLNPGATKPSACPI